MAVRKNSTKIVITEAGLLLPKGKSKRLASLAKPTHKSDGLEKLAVLTGGKEVIKLNQKALALLKNAALKVDIRIAEIKKNYPPSKQNKMFAVRYGDLEKLKKRRLEEIFELLEIEKPPKFNLIAELNYFGVKVSYTD